MISWDEDVLINYGLVVTLCDVLCIYQLWISGKIQIYMNFTRKVLRLLQAFFFLLEKNG